MQSDPVLPLDQRTWCSRVSASMSRSPLFSHGGHRMRRSCVCEFRRSGGERSHLSGDSGIGPALAMDTESTVRQKLWHATCMQSFSKPHWKHFFSRFRRFRMVLLTFSSSVVSWFRCASMPSIAAMPSIQLQPAHFNGLFCLARAQRPLLPGAPGRRRRPAGAPSCPTHPSACSPPALAPSPIGSSNMIAALALGSYSVLGFRRRSMDAAAAAPAMDKVRGIFKIIRICGLHPKLGEPSRAPLVSHALCAYLVRQLTE